MKIKFTIFLGILWMCIAHVLAQDTTPKDSTSIWKRNGSINFNFSNVGLENWAGGGQNAISAGTILDYKAIRETTKSYWDMAGNFAYGLAKVGNSQNIFKKTDDQLLLGTNYGYKFSEFWSFAGGMGVRTQVSPGYNYTRDAQGKEVAALLISDFFAPGYVNLNVGVSYKNKVFRATLSPLSNKLTFVLNDSLSKAGAFGVKQGDKVRSELGANFNTALDWNIMENVNFKSTLNLFANYETLDLIDVNWETLLVLKVNKYIHTSFGTQMIYDHDVLIKQGDGTEKQAVQFKHVLNVNVGFKM
jgi:hypothetical protein